MVEWGRMGWALGSLGDLWAAAGRGVVQVCGSLAYHSTLVQAYHCALARSRFRFCFLHSGCHYSYTIMLRIFLHHVLPRNQRVGLESLMQNTFQKSSGIIMDSKVNCKPRYIYWTVKYLLVFVPAPCLCLMPLRVSREKCTLLFVTNVPSIMEELFQGKNCGGRGKC